MNKEKQLPQLKVYDIDYEFLIKNYLDTKYWDKEWCIFVFDNYYYYLSMESINTKKRTIAFNLTIKQLSNYSGFYKTYSTSIDHYLNNETIEDLKKKIGTGLIRITEIFEEIYIIKKDSTYVSIQDSREEEEEKLKEIAEAFLDENNVINEDIRKVYIDSYVNNNSKIWDMASTYCYNNKYLHLSNLFLLLVDIFKKDKLKKDIIYKLENKNVEIKELLDEVEEYKNEIEKEEWEFTMKDNLESI